MIVLSCFFSVFKGAWRNIQKSLFSYDKDSVSHVRVHPVMCKSDSYTKRSFLTLLFVRDNFYGMQSNELMYLLIAT